MSLGPIVIGTTTFEETSRGRYVDTSLAFGAPKNEIRVSPGTYSSKSKPPRTTCAINRIVEFQVGTTEEPKIAQVVVNVNIQVTEGATATQADAAVGDLSEVITEAFLNKVLNGAS